MKILWGQLWWGWFGFYFGHCYGVITLLLKCMLRVDTGGGGDPSNILPLSNLNYWRNETYILETGGVFFVGADPWDI